jgi:5-methylcytosine-specific restriction endonuclease McrA
MRDWFTRRKNTKRANGGSYTAEEWDTLRLLCGGRCVACGQIAELEVDHIVPVSVGGSNDIENIQPLCRSCNASKGATTEDYRPLTLVASMGLALQT